MAFKFNSLIRRASYSLMRSRGGVVGRRFPPFVRFLTGSVDKSSPPPKEAAEETSGKDGLLDGLPFDIKDGGPDEGYLTLIRKCQDEIIEVKVRPFYGSIYHLPGGTGNTNLYDREQLLKFFGLGEFVEDRYEYHEDLRAIGFDGDYQVKGLMESDDDDKWSLDYREIKFLYMIVKIYYGDNCKKWLKFFLLAYPDGIKIPIITTSVEGDTKHLDEYEEFLKHRGIEPSIINALLSKANFIPRLKI